VKSDGYLHNKSVLCVSESGHIVAVVYIHKKTIARCWLIPLAGWGLKGLYNKWAIIETRASYSLE
jgi:hypothetical protein